MAKLSTLLLGSLLWFSTMLCAEEHAAADNNVQSILHDSGFSLLPDLPLKNQIPLLDNRFRIDENVSEITLLFFRRRGSASVVLVQPDGNKLYYRNADDKTLHWHDGRSYDLIRINNPMAGPWQAVGRISPESRIMVLSDITLDVDPLPASLMAGETVKVTARLNNGEQPVNVKDFRDVLALEVLFISTNNAQYDNLGRGVVQVAQFRDDGRGYDEKARDGIFTGELQLNFLAGEWTPKYIVKTPLYTREIEQAPVVLLPAPLTPETVLSDNDRDAHYINFKLTNADVLANNLLLQGRIRYPSGEIENFVLNEATRPARQLAIQNKGHGSYIVETSVFGQTVTGREFMLIMPEVSFVINHVTHQAPELEVLPQQILDEIAAEQAPVVLATEPEAFPWGLVISANLLILGCGGFAIWFVMTDRKLNLPFVKKKKTADSTTQPEITEIKETPPKDKTVEKAQKNNDMDDILDLSLPDD